MPKNTVALVALAGAAGLLWWLYKGGARAGSSLPALPSLPSLPALPPLPPLGYSGSPDVSSGARQFFGPAWSAPA